MVAYLTLCRRVAGVWHPQFGDYERAIVNQELRDTKDGGYAKRKDLKVIRHADTKAALDEALRNLNVRQTQPRED